MSHFVTCPLCLSRLALLAPSCPGCGGDISALAALRELADRHFNDAVKHSRTGRWNLAAESIAVAIALNPDDTEARELHRKVRHQQEKQLRRVRAPLVRARRPRWATERGTRASGR